jgi:hypothetical protein
VDLGDGALPEVHPSLIEYLNQEAVRRALNQEHHGTDVVEDREQISASLHADNQGSSTQVYLARHQPQEVVTMPDSSESQALSHLNQQTSHCPIQFDDRSLGGPPSLHVEKATSVTQPINFNIDQNRVPILTPSTFNIPQLAGTGAFTHVDWFSFMRDCGIMDIEDG